jgi:hypothetical protein
MILMISHTQILNTGRDGRRERERGERGSEEREGARRERERGERGEEEERRGEERRSGRFSGSV